MRYLPTLAVFLLPILAAATEAPRLNILFVFADDWGRYASAYQAVDGKGTINDAIKTPNVDRIAREGVLFRRAFVNAPSCTPCRSSMLTGRYFFNTGQGAILNGAVWDPAIPSFPLLLRDAGYHIGKSYKVWSPGTPADAPFGGQRHAYEKAGKLSNNFSEEVTKIVASGTPLDAARETLLAEVRGNFDAFIADRKPGQPFLYFFGTTTTHRMWIKGSGKKLWGIEPEALKGKMPGFLPDVPEVREDVADYLGECQAVDAYIGVLLKKLEDLGELDRTIVVVTGDHGMPGVPAGKCNLYDHGTSVALAIRWPGGAGNPPKNPGRVIDDFFCMPDIAPTFLEIGGVTPPTGLYGRSILPLLNSDRAGQIDPARDSVVTGRERHVGTAREGNLPYPMRALRTDHFLYVRNFAPDRWPMGAPLSAAAPGSPPPLEELERNTFAAFPDMDASPIKAWLIWHGTEPAWKPAFDFAFSKRPGEELYDLRKDPQQMRNVATDPAYAAEREKFAAALLKTLTEAGDPRVTGDGQTFERPPFTDVMEKGPRRKAPAQ